MPTMTMTFQSRFNIGDIVTITSDAIDRPHATRYRVAAIALVMRTDHEGECFTDIELELTGSEMGLIRTFRILEANVQCYKRATVLAKGQASE